MSFKTARVHVSLEIRADSEPMRTNVSIDWSECVPLTMSQMEKSDSLFNFEEKYSLDDSERRIHSVSM